MPTRSLMFLNLDRFLPYFRSLTSLSPRPNHRVPCPLLLRHLFSKDFNCKFLLCPLWYVNIFTKLLPVLQPRNDFLKDLKTISKILPGRLCSYYFISVGGKKSKFGGHLNPESKTTSCYKNMRIFISYG